MLLVRIHFCVLLILLPVAATLAASASADGRQTYLVSFEEPPVASFDGLAAARSPKGIALKATSPAVTGAPRLDVNKAEVRAYREHLADRRKQHLDAAARLIGRALLPSFEYDIVNHGVAVALTADEARRIAKLPGVLRVEREQIYHLQTDAGPRWIGAEQVWNATDGLGTRGEGRVIGVVDGGINHTHPAFAAVGPVDGHVHVNPRGRLFGLCVATPTLCNAKLIGIDDFTICTGIHNQSGCEDNQPNNGSGDDDHGSHVAATAAGNVLNVNLSSLVTSGQTTVQVSGVAPHAALISYKVCESDCRGSWIVAALNQAVADGVDVINISLGGGAVDPWGDALSAALLAAREANVFVATSAGNDGPAAGSLGSPGNAPWVLAVANSSHDRVIANRLVDLTGGASAAPSGGVLFGVGQTAGYGPAPLLIPNDHPGCSTGTDLDATPNGSSNPWSAPNRFAGEIVVCERGTQARVAKSNNVRLAGGGGMVLINQASDGESINADSHSIPSSHLGYNAGRALVEWLSTGSDHRGRIEGSKIIYEAALADVLAGSSSRGPVAAGDFMKPGVAAPGSSILAAAGNGNGFAFLTGTSMASPHVAGAGLLLRAARPTWTVTDIESALIGTALPVLRDSDGVTPASVMQQGAGRVSLGAALKAGLSFPVTRAEFLSANPSTSGNTRALNQPALVHSACMETCNLTRRVRDIAGGGRWRAEVAGVDGLGIQVTPQEFTLAAGATQSLQFRISIESPALLGRWAEGEVRLRRIDGSDGAVAVTRIPLAAFASAGALPAQIDLSASSDRGFQGVELSGLVPLADLKLAATVPASLRVTERSMAKDPTEPSVYDSFGAGTFVELLTIPASSSPRPYRLMASTRSATAPDIDLYVGLDSDGDGQPDEDEELCGSAGPDANERCDLELASAAQQQTIWVLVQSYAAGPSGSDVVTLETLLNDLTPSPLLVVTGPSTTGTGETFALRFGWDDPALLPGNTRVSYLQIAIADNAPFATVPVHLSRSILAVSTAARVLEPGKRQPIQLLAGAAQDRLFVDVPANASALVVRTESSGSIDLYAARIDTPAGPATGQAPPRAQAQASAVGVGGNKQLRIEGSALQPGRWFITPVNSGSSTAMLDLDIAFEYAGPRPPLAAGAYFNPDRSGAGSYIYEVGDNWAYFWYTFLQDGTPTWYLGAGPKPTANQSVWRVSLERYTWNGEVASPTTVGEAILSFSDPQAFQFSWNLDGETGSERYLWIDPGGCPQSGGSPIAVSGGWYPPSTPGVGYSIFASQAIEAHAAYFYDAQGIARWLFGSTAPYGGSTIPLFVNFGFCPLCPYQPPLTVPAGTLTRSYSGNDNGQIRVEFEWPAPLSGSWSFERPVERLTDPVSCEP